MATSSHPSQLGYFQETTSGTAPANAAAWASETRLKHIADSLDISGVKQQVVDDMNAQVNIFGQNQKKKGLKNGFTVPFSLYATGTGATTADGSQVAEIDLMTVLDHCWGGLHRGNSEGITTVTSQTQFDLDAEIGRAHV